jgi:hypothetical protein
MSKLKIIGIFLVVLFGIFIINGIMLGAIMFFYVLKYIVYAAIIAALIYLYHKTNKK